jgi:ABC-type multidrug transport system fused ATPase/permease subunit
MIAIIEELKFGFQSLFPGGRFRYVLIVLSMLGAVISVSELLVLKFFVQIVLQEGKIERNQFIILGTSLALFFIITRLAQYYQRNYRVKAFARSFKSLKKAKKKGAGNPEWAMAFEISSILTHATQLVAVLVFIIILEPLFALLNFLVILGVLTYIARLFTKQLHVQLELQTERDGKKARPQKRYGTRIRAAENGALAAGVGMIILLGALLCLSYNGEISVANTLIIFFGARLQNGSLSHTSRSLMRYARAKAGQKSREEDDE